MLRALFEEAPCAKVPEAWDGGSENEWVQAVWQAWRPYFMDRLNDLGREGWQLAEPFEILDEHQRPTIPTNRLPYQAIQVGRKIRHVIKGATFVMRRTTLASPTKVE